MKDPIECVTSIQDGADNNEEFTLRIWNSMLIKLRLQCTGNVCRVLVYCQSVYSTQLCVHTEQWIHNFGLTPVLAQRLAVWGIHN